ncbi:MAG: hypothetical protein K2X66_03720, partial [Cyanobacteria bacterium]|nr:hypothetical protein [Cyanobacteriota bacterium]
ESVAAFKRGIYDGEIFLLPAHSESLEFVDGVKSQLKTLFPGTADLQTLHLEQSGENLYQQLSPIRQMISEPDMVLAWGPYLFNSFFKKYGTEALFALNNICMDRFRLRCNPPMSADLPNGNSEPVYRQIHRDTWYANPHCQINGWISLFDGEVPQTFRFFPLYFHTSIENTSSDFDYGEWSKVVGFQSPHTTSSQAYPTVKAPPENSLGQGFSCKAGDLLLFSGHHLHQTSVNTTPFSRLSVDFRWVDVEDKRMNRGPLNVDNASAGDASLDYLPLVTLTD